MSKDKNDNKDSLIRGKIITLCGWSKYADVENVFVAWPVDSEEEKKMRAKPGAGTEIIHWLVKVL